MRLTKKNLKDFNKDDIFFTIIYHDNKLVGAALFGPLSTTAWKRYGKFECDVVELRRLVLLDECRKNTESWMISRCLKEIKKKTT